LFFKRITMSHDMTKNEIDGCKKLVDEAKQKEIQDVSGELIYRVRGPPVQMRIISIQKIISIKHALYTNADCLLNKLSELILLIESLKQKPNIIAITEFKDKCSKEYIF